MPLKSAMSMEECIRLKMRNLEFSPVLTNKRSQIGIKIGITLVTSSDIFSLLHLVHHSAFSSLAGPAAMKIYCVCIRKEFKNSHRTSSWSPFDCFGTPTWRPWLHVERGLYLFKYVTMEARVKARRCELKLDIVVRITYM